MKKFYFILIILSIFVFIDEVIAQRSSKRNSSSRARASSSASVSNITSSSSSSNSFNSCMDTYCISESSEEKGRCRCSSGLPRIEKILRDIEEIQNDADKMNKELEALMNVNDTSMMNSALGNVYENINSIEKKAKNSAANKLDSKLLVMEGMPLFEEALNKCSSFTSSKSESDVEKMKQDYNSLVDSDCASYATILKEKADSASNLLAQSQKNREMYEQQEYESRNQLSTDACFVEYESCMKTACGEEFTSCIETAKFEASLKKCEAVNYGKCEDTKATVLVDIRKMMQKAIEKFHIRQSCLSAMGRIENGQCLFTVVYVAERCTTSKNCGSSDMQKMTPGTSFTCDDSKGPFKELILGCKESCYLVGSNGNERYLGKNGSFFCAKPDKVSLPVPAGWGTDGYPTNPELKGAF